MIIEGSIACKAALFNAYREVEMVYIDKDKKSRDFRYIINFLNDNDIAYQLVDREIINNLASTNTNGGIILQAGPRTYQNLCDIKENVVFYINGVEDPYNIGYMMRTLKAFGYNELILSKRDYTNMEATILRSSAGAFDMMDIYILNDEYEDLLKLKDRYCIYALNRSERAKNIFDYHYDNQKKIIMIGGEKRGISKTVLSLLDQELYIDYPSDFKNALNAYAALDVMVTVLRLKQ